MAGGLLFIILLLPAAALAAPSYVVGPECDALLAFHGPERYRLGAELSRGNAGRVHPVEGEDLPADSVVKIYEDRDGNRLSRDQVLRHGQRYETARRLFGAACVEYRGVVETEPGVYGVVMSRLADGYADLNIANARRHTLDDLKRIRETLLANRLYIYDFQFTLDAQGRVVLRDLDGLASWDPQSPLYEGRDENWGRARVGANLSGWIRYLERRLPE